MPTNPESHRPALFRLSHAGGLCIAMLSATAACTPQTDADTTATRANPASSGATPKTAAPTPRFDERMASPIDRLARAMATSGLTWATVDGEHALTGLKELEDKPAGMDRARSARTVLPGYGAAKLPQGAGAGYTEVDGNEGEAQVALYGGPTSVNWLTVSKYYEERDARAFVAKILPSFRITDQSPACAGAPAGAQPVPMLLHLAGDRPDAKPLSAVVNVDDTAKYGPAVTMFSLYAHEPTPFEIGCPIIDDHGEK